MALSEIQQNKSSNESMDLSRSSEPAVASAIYPEFCSDPAFFSISGVSVAVASCHAILIPLTVLGNGSVILAFALNTRLRTATNIFIVGLAASDLLVGTFAIPFWTFVVSHENIMVAYCFAVYHVYISFDVFAGSASILQLTAIAMERFFSMQWPLFHRKMSRWVYCIMLAFAWSCATLAAALNPLQEKSETWRKFHTMALFVICFGCPFTIIFACYGYIFKISRFQARRRLSSGSNARRCGSTPGFAIRELNVAITVAVITGVFVVAWMPFFVVSLIATFCLTCLPSAPTLLHLVKFFKFLQYSSSCLNPYIYAYRNKEMRRTLIKIKDKLFPCIPAGFRKYLQTAKKRDSAKCSIQLTDKAIGLESYQANSEAKASLEKDVCEDQIKMKLTRKAQRKDKKRMAVILL